MPKDTTEHINQLLSTVNTPNKSLCESLVSVIVMFSLLMFLLFTYACTEVYLPDLENGDNILYIEGGITNTQGPHTVHLRFTAGYNDKAEFMAARGANISLLEDGSLVSLFKEMGDGIYSTDSLFEAQVGSTYTLLIEMPDGNRYESLPQKLPSYNIPIDTVYGIKETRKIKYYNVNGEFILQEEEVNQLYADIASAAQNTYYRFSSQLVLEHASGIITDPDSDEPDLIDLYLWDSFYPNTLSIIEVNSGRDKLRKFPLTFTREDNEGYSELKHRYFNAIQDAYDERIARIVQVEMETDSGIFMVDSIIYGIDVTLSESDYYFGWIVNIDQYSITQEAYTFWTDVQKVEESEGEIFDPIATQLRGNMQCVSDENRLMLGLFEVASKKTIPAFVNYISESGNYYGTRINLDPSFTNNGWNDSIPPAFWVDKLYINPQ